MPSAKNKKPSDDSSTEERQRTTIVLTKSLYRALKIYAVNHDQDMSEVVTEALHKLGIEG